MTYEKFIHIYIWIIPTTILFLLAKLINIAGRWVFEGPLLIYCSGQITVDYKNRREMERMRELSDTVPYFVSGAVTDWRQRRESADK